MTLHYEFKVEEKDLRKRIDIFLAENIKEFSRSAILSVMNSSAILLNNQPIKKAGKKLKTGDTIVFSYTPEPSHVEPQNIPLNILYEDEYIVAINKKAGMVVHPGAGNRDNTLLNAILYYLNLPDNSFSGQNGAMIHRLDKDTSGVILAAKNREALEKFQQLFAQRKIKKTYNAIISGRLKQNSGIFDTMHARSKHDRRKFTSKTETGRRAITEWKIIYEGILATVLEISIHTGRTHQIRVHFSDIGHPVIGDKLYGIPLSKPSVKKHHEEYFKLISFGRMALHSRQIEFVHPFTKKNLIIEASLPQQFLSIINFYQNFERI